MIHHAKYEQNKGKQQLKQNNLAGALDSYTAALHYITKVENQHEVAKLLCNRSLLHLKMCHPHGALQDAKNAIQIDVQWHKAC